LVKVRAAVLDVRIHSVGLRATRVLAFVVDGTVTAECALVVLAVFGLLVKQLIVRAGLSLDFIVLAVKVAFKKTIN
jgi:hypothetical protein